MFLNKANFPATESRDKSRIVGWSTPTFCVVSRVQSFLSCLTVVPLSPFHLREIFNAQEQYKTKSFLSQDIDILLFCHNFSIKRPQNLQELWSDQASTVIYTDTSDTTGWGSVLQPPHEATRSSAGCLASQEVLEMIVLKELKACRHGLYQNVEAVHGRTVKPYQDNITWSW